MFFLPLETVLLVIGEFSLPLETVSLLIAVLFRPKDCFIVDRLVQYKSLSTLSDKAQNQLKGGF